ncbi:TVP38/TMEM64 family protein [Paenibacillus sp. JX-17]|uniref:TVP38/TMEM64 family membrane protein n=1 Tax=Paenibacillus lacisoli TaxID=3064525 RepID=A0ABT9C7G2_9BACL|nr:TVP38/TMEM64 family protein [Paenibacillus sp. JX-17]MDO7905212.1 TVP38/TMEM64 family protein [Paenibacillus sp. JX-17]
MRKWLIPAGYVSVLGLAFIYRYELLDWARAPHPWPVLVLIAACLALFPIIPYKLVIALIGYAYGAWWGAVICWIGSTAAAVLIYGAVRLAFQEQGRRYLDRIPGLGRLTDFMEKHPFGAILIARLLPIVPQPAVNVYAGVALFPFWSYTLASGIGKLPGIALYAFLGGTLLDHPVQAVILFAAYLGLAGGSLWGYRLWLAKKQTSSKPSS